jgi:hypothetical protein
MTCFNDSTSEIAIHELRKNGKLGPQVDYKDFRGKMSFVSVFKKGTARYLTLINYDLGELGIVKLNNNGTMGGGQSYNIGAGWTNAVIKEVGDPTYLALFNFNNGKVTTYSITSDARLGAKAYEAPWNIQNKYNIIEVFGENIICYNSQTGYARKASISASGSFQTFIGQPIVLDKNWSTLKYVTQRNNYGESIKSILILNKTSGQIKQYQWNENNYIGEIWYDSAKVKGNLQPGFDTVTPYQVFDGNRYQSYAMISNSTTGKVITYHLNNNL